MARFSRKELSGFTRQLGEMFQSGVPLARALEVLSEDENSSLGLAAQQLLRRVETGHSFSDALRRNSNKFPKSLVVLVTIGEQTGTMGRAIVQASEWMDDDEDLVQSVKSALTYPLLVVIVSIGLTLFLFTTVVPKLLEVVVGLGAELPLATRLIQFICFVLTQPSFWLAVLGVLLIVGALLSRDEARAKVFKQIVLLGKQMPVLGPTLVSFYHARFCAGFAVLSRHGVDVLRAVALAQEVSGDPEMVADRRAFRERVQNGESLTDSMKARPDLYDDLLVSFIMLGEESARMSDSVVRAEELYRMLVQEKIEGLKQALEPILTIGVGALVAFVLVATLLPLYSVMSKF